MMLGASKMVLAALFSIVLRLSGSVELLDSYTSLLSTSSPFGIYLICESCFSVFTIPLFNKIGQFIEKNNSKLFKKILDKKEEKLMEKLEMEKEQTKDYFVQPKMISKTIPSISKQLDDLRDYRDELLNSNVPTPDDEFKLLR